MKETDSLTRSIFYYLIGLLILLVLNAFLIYVSKQQLKKASDFFRAIQIVETNIDALESDVIRGIDTGLRGYAITGKIDILDPFEHAPVYFEEVKSNINTQLDILEYEPSIFEHLFSTVEEYINYTTRLRVLLDSVGLEAFKAELSLDKGLQPWLAYQADRTQLIKRMEQDRLSMEKQTDTMQLYMLSVQLVSFILSIVLFTLIYRRISIFSKDKNTYINQIKLSNNALKKLHESLEIEVIKKTMDLASTNQELEAVIDNMKRMQSQMIQSEKMASIGIMISGIAHEFNNALNFVKGGSQLLINWVQQRDHDTSEVEPMKNAVVLGIDRIEKIVKSLQLFSLEDVKSSYQPILLQEVIDNALLLLKPKIPENVSVEVKLDMKQALMLNRANIQHVLIQLIDNAIDAMNSAQDKKDSIIKIETTQFEDLAILKVVNNGPKINDEKLNHLFDPFFTTKDPGKGTGLGLSVCYAIVHDHKGKIYAQNNEEGVEFVVELPLKTA